MNLKLKVWRQKNATRAGKLVDIEARNIPEDCSFLEMLDIVNEDYRERRRADRVRSRLPRGHLRHVLADDQRRAARAERDDDLPALHAQVQGRRHDLRRAVPRRPFPVVAISSSIAAPSTASSRRAASSPRAPARAPDGNAIPIPKDERRRRDGSRGLHRLRRLRGGLPERAAMLFVGQGFAPRPAAAGQPERTARALKMVAQMDEEGFGNCSNYYECEAVCPAEIRASVIAQLNREYALATLRKKIGE